MKIVESDLRRGLVRVRVETTDDLWVLKNIIKVGDVVVARTLRDVKIDGEGKRRLPMTLAIKVKNVYFQHFSNRLRVHGIIIEGPERYGLRGSHHTLNIDVGSEVVIIKELWSKAELGRLRSSSKRWVKALLVATDFDELSIALLYNQGVKYLLDKSLPSINNEDPDSISKVVSNIVRYVLEEIEREDPEVVVIGSPAVIKDYIAERLINSMGNRKVKVYKDSIASGGRAGIEELIRRDVVKNLLKDLITVEIEEVLNEFMGYIVRRPERIAYGIEDIRAAIKANAVKKLLVCEDLLSSDLRDEVEEIISNVEANKGYVRIVPRESPSYYRVKALGCIIAILRYDLSIDLRRNMVKE